MSKQQEILIHGDRVGFRHNANLVPRGARGESSPGDQGAWSINTNDEGVIERGFPIIGENGEKLLPQDYLVKINRATWRTPRYFMVPATMLKPRTDTTRTALYTAIELQRSAINAAAALGRLAEYRKTGREYVVDAVIAEAAIEITPLSEASPPLAPRERNEAQPTPDWWSIYVHCMDDGSVHFGDCFEYPTHAMAVAAAETYAEKAFSPTGSRERALPKVFTIVKHGARVEPYEAPKLPRSQTIY